MRTAARAGALLGLASAAAHVALLADPPGGPVALGALPLATVAMAGLGVLCLPCAWHLWRSPSASGWGLTAALDAGMLAVHLPVLAGDAATPGHAGHAGHSAAAWPVAAGTAVLLASLALALAVLLHGAARALRSATTS